MATGQHSVASEAAEHLNAILASPKVSREYRIRIASPGSDPESSVLVHCVRHGQAEHNLLADQIGQQAYRDPKCEDAVLTQLGKDQASKLSAQCSDLASTGQMDVIAVSPLRRTLETMSLATAAVPTGVPRLAIEALREQIGQNICDKRQSVAAATAGYPGVDFSNVKTDADTWWTTDRETKAAMNDRVYDFLDWVRARGCKSIGVFSHSSLLFSMFNGVLECDDESTKAWFSTGEMRSVRLQFIKSDVGTTDPAPAAEVAQAEAQAQPAAAQADAQTNAIQAEQYAEAAAAPRAEQVEAEAAIAAYTAAAAATAAAQADAQAQAEAGRVAAEKAEADRVAAEQEMAAQFAPEQVKQAAADVAAAVTAAADTAAADTSVSASTDDDEAGRVAAEAAAQAAAEAEAQAEADRQQLQQQLEQQAAQQQQQQQQYLQQQQQQAQIAAAEAAQREAAAAQAAAQMAAMASAGSPEVAEVAEVAEARPAKKAKLSVNPYCTPTCTDANGEMVGCDNPRGCRHGEWFHPECLGLATAPTEDSWYCPACRKDQRMAQQAQQRQYQQQQQQQQQYLQQQQFVQQQQYQQYQQQQQQDSPDVPF